MSEGLDRRFLLAATPVALAGLVVDRAVGKAINSPAAGKPGPLYPTQSPEVVREVVGKAHSDLARVQELVEPRPELARAAWDWGFGDWESALGAASHVGRRDIAEYLISKGARPNLFTFTMLGEVEVVRAVVRAQPGIQSQPGPHGISLLSHARAGGEAAAPVVAFLEEVGGANERPVDEPLADGDKHARVGHYAFGPEDRDRFEVEISRRGQLSLLRSGGTARTLFHQGGGEFHPSGAPSVRIRFLRQGQSSAVSALEIHNPGLIVRAHRI